jgi:transposase
MHVVSSNPIKPRRIHMSRKLFTEEQIAALRQNPYVYSVSRSTLVLRKSFKEIFYTEYMEGVYPKDVFKKYGFDPAVLGERRIC